MKIKLSKKQKQLIQKTAKLEEMRGYKTSASVIAGLILVTGNRGLCFEDIQDTLELSKGAVSLGINLLLGTRELEEFKKFGERRRYFRFSDSISAEGYLSKTLDYLNQYESLLLELLHDPELDFDDVFLKRVERNFSFIKYVIDNLKCALDKWDEKETK